MQQPLSDAALDELDAFDFDLSDENSELDWVPEDVQSSDAEFPQVSEPTAAEQQQSQPEGQGAVSTGNPGNCSAMQAQDAFDELLDQLQTNANSSTAAASEQRQHASSAAAAQALHPTLSSPSGVASPGFDIGSIPDVSLEGLNALMQTDISQGHPAEDDNEYEAFLKVLRGEADMELPEDDLEDEDFTIDLEELLHFSEAPPGADAGAPPERRLTRASWRPAPLPPAKRKHGASSKPYRPRAPRQPRPLSSTLVQQARQGQGQSGKRNYAMPALTMPVPPGLWQPPTAMSAEQAASLYQQVAQHTQLLVQSTMLAALQGGKQPLAGYLTSLLSQLQGFVARQAQARQAALQPPWSPLSLGMCSGPDWLKAHAVVMGPPAPEAPASGARPEPAYFLRPVWSCADVPTLPIMPHFLGAIYQATAAPAQPHQSPPGAMLQAAYTSMLPFSDPALLPSQGGKTTRPGAWMPAEDALLDMGIRRYGHQYERIRLALVPVHPVYDIMARFRLNSSSGGSGSDPKASSSWTQEAEDLLITGIRRCGADYHRIHHEWLPCHSTQDIAAMHRGMFRSYGPGIFQEASAEEVAPLQPPEVAVIAAGLQLHGQSSQRWELIAGSLPGRKPPTLARLWFHHSSADKSRQRGPLNIPARPPSRQLQPATAAVSASMSAAQPSLAPQSGPPAAAASAPAALTAAHTSLAPQPLLIQQAPASAHLMDHNGNAPRQLPTADPALGSSADWQQNLMASHAELPCGSPPDLHDPLTSCSQAPGPPQPSSLPQPHLCSRSAVRVDDQLPYPSQSELQRGQQHSNSRVASGTMQQAPSASQPASPEPRMEEPAWHDDDACAHDAPDLPSPPAWHGSPDDEHLEGQAPDIVPMANRSPAASRALMFSSPPARIGRPDHHRDADAEFGPGKAPAHSSHAGPVHQHQLQAHPRQRGSTHDHDHEPPAEVEDTGGNAPPASNAAAAAAVAPGVDNSAGCTAAAAAACEAPVAASTAGEGTAHMLSMLQQFLTTFQAQQQQQQQQQACSLQPQCSVPAGPVLQPARANVQPPTAESSAQQTIAEGSQQAKARPSQGPAPSQQALPVVQGPPYSTLQISLQNGATAGPSVMSLRLGPDQPSAPGAGAHGIATPRSGEGLDRWEPTGHQSRQGGAPAEGPIHAGPSGTGTGNQSAARLAPRSLTSCYLAQQLHTRAELGTSSAPVEIDGGSKAALPSPSPQHAAVPGHAPSTLIFPSAPRWGPLPQPHWSQQHLAPPSMYHHHLMLPSHSPWAPQAMPPHPAGRGAAAATPRPLSQGMTHPMSYQQLHAGQTDRSQATARHADQVLQQQGQQPMQSCGGDGPHEQGKGETEGSKLQQESRGGGILQGNVPHRQQRDESEATAPGCAHQGSGKAHETLELAMQLAQRLPRSEIDRLLNLAKSSQSVPSSEHHQQQPVEAHHAIDDLGNAQLSGHEREQGSRDIDRRGAGGPRISPRLERKRVAAGQSRAGARRQRQNQAGGSSHATVRSRSISSAGNEQCALDLLAAASHLADSADESDQDAHPS